MIKEIKREEQIEKIDEERIGNNVMMRDEKMKNRWVKRVELKM